MAGAVFAMAAAASRRGIYTLRVVLAMGVGVAVGVWLASINGLSTIALASMASSPPSPAPPPPSPRPPDTAFDLDHANPDRVTILIVSDRRHVDKFTLQAATLRSYAARHGYHFVNWIPDEQSANCKARYISDFFFQKHCAVRTFLLTQPPRSAVYVLDGDIVVAAPEVPLDRWLEGQHDVVFYERDWTYEITSGGYIIRNTPIAHEFLVHWENYYLHRPRGFSSSDNGALHLALLQMLALPYEHCMQLYHNLEDNANRLVPFYNYIACTRKELGPARSWRIELTPNVEGAARKWLTGSMIVHHRMCGFQVDGYLYAFRPGGLIPMHHGIKDPQEGLERYGFEFRERDLGGTWGSSKELIRKCALEVACEMRINTALSNPIMSTQDFNGISVNTERHFIESKRKYLRKDPSYAVIGMEQVPILNLERCLPNLNCKPVHMDNSRYPRTFFQTSQDLLPDAYRVYEFNHTLATSGA